MEISRPGMSCAVRQVGGIPSHLSASEFCSVIWKNTLPNMMAFGHEYRFVQFSHKESMFYQCEEFCKFIEDNKLGTIMRSNISKNPNSGNRVRIYLWEIDWTEYDKWAWARGLFDPSAINPSKASSGAWNRVTI